MQSRRKTSLDPARVGARALPHPTIDGDLMVEDARDRMLTTGAERLVVIVDDAPFAVVSRRDLDLAEATGTDPRAPLRRVCRRPFRCDPGARAGRTARQMASAGYTSALVVEDGEPVGVFAPGDRRIGPKTRPSARPRVAVKRVTRLGDVVGSHGALPSDQIGKL